MPAASTDRTTTRAIAVAVALTLLLSACGGGEDPVSDAGPADASPSASAPVASEPASAAEPDPAAPSDAPSDAEGDAAPQDDTDQTATGDGPGNGQEGCPAVTELAITMVRLDGEEVVLPATTFPGGHFVLDLDGSGFGPTLGGVLTTDASADPIALGESWASPEDPAEGSLHVTVLLQGPPAGETTFPLGTYGVTEADGVVAPTEGMGLAALERHNPDGSSNPMNHGNQLELTHIGDGVICGTISPNGREPGQSNPVTRVVGSFAATLAEQP